MRRVTAPDTISLDDIRAIAQARFGDMIKGGVDDPATRAAIAAFIARVVHR